MTAESDASLRSRIRDAFRRTGATLPSGDPRPTHDAEMEGWFWRITDARHGRVLVVLCGINRHPAGAWATVAIATHPGNLVRAGVLGGAHASSTSFAVSAGDAADARFSADERCVSVRIGDTSATIRLDRVVGWPLRLGGGGIFSVLPFLGQYWHPHILGGSASGTVQSAGSDWSFDDADVYAEKNWGAGFPERWWWGQAQAFDDRDACVAFGGGVLQAGPVAIRVGGVVARVGDEVLRFTPPLARIRARPPADATGRWEVSAVRRGQRIRIVGEPTGCAHVLPVPLPAQRRNVFTDHEHLAARMYVELDGRVEFRGVSQLAGLEIGSRPDRDQVGGAAMRRPR